MLKKLAKLERLSRQLDPDAIDIHKFHCVGLRQGIYGEGNRLGMEIRAALQGDLETLTQITSQTATIIAEGHLDKLEPLRQH